ncbi:MAG: hypothetical protein WEA04_02850 [Candidatus Andersenbacteria bacterium]
MNTRAPVLNVEIVPAILRRTYEKIEADWNTIQVVAHHVQIDITDGIFAGDGSFRDLPRFKRLVNSEKIELHLMVHTPAHYVDGVVDLNPARCVFHLEAFSGTNDLQFIYQKLRAETQAQLALAINPESPTARLEEFLPLLDYVLFMGYNPGWANQPLNPIVYNKIRSFREQHADFPVAVDGHVNRETIEPFIRAGAGILCANTAIFGQGEPVENYRQLTLLAEAAHQAVRA